MKNPNQYWDLYRQAKGGEVNIPADITEDTRKEFLRVVEDELQPLLALKEALTGRAESLSNDQRVVVDLGYANLVAYPGADYHYKEVYIDLEEKDGTHLQDLAMVGGAYHYDASGEVVHDKGISVKLWGSEHREEITHEFDVGVREFEKDVEVTCYSKSSADEHVKEAVQKIVANVRKDLETTYGTDLAGHCIEASDKITEALATHLGIDATVVEGWCRLDDENYGSDHPWDPHTWVEIRSLGLYIDATADQFNCGMYPEHEYPKIIVQEGLPHGMQYDEPVWQDFGYDKEYEFRDFETLEAATEYLFSHVVGLKEKTVETLNAQIQSAEARASQPTAANGRTVSEPSRS